MFAILLIFILIRPFICSLAFPFLEYVYGISLLSLLALWCLLKGMPFKNSRSIRLPLIFFSIALALSAVLHGNLRLEGASLFPYLSGLLLMLVVSSLPPKDAFLIIKVIALGAIIASLVAINQYFFEFDFLKRYLAIHQIVDPTTLEYASRNRVFLPFLTPNALAGYLGMTIPFFLLRKKWMPFSIPVFIAFFLTQSIGALVSLFLALCVFFMLRAKTGNKEVLFFLLFAAAGAAVFSVRVISSHEYLQPLFSGIARMEYWKETLILIKGYPFAGVGIGNFDIPLSRFAHNLYLQLWAEGGIFVLASFLWLIITVLRQAFAARTRESKDSLLTVSLIASVLFFLIHNTFDFTFYLPEVSMSWWIILGILLQHNSYESDHRNTDL